MTYEEAIRELEILRDWEIYGDKECEAVEIAISSMEKQIPIKAEEEGDAMWRCPKCETTCFNYSIIQEYGGTYHCSFCGQAIKPMETRTFYSIDWSDDDD